MGGGRRAGVGKCGAPHAAWKLVRASVRDRGVRAQGRQGQTAERCFVINHIHSLPASSRGDLTYGVAESALEPSPRRRPRPHAACGLPSSRRLCLPVLRSPAPRTGILWWSTDPP